MRNSDDTLKQLCGYAADAGALLVRPDSTIACRFNDDRILQQHDSAHEFDKIIAKVLRLEE